MTIGEAILRIFCRSPQQGDYSEDYSHEPTSSALCLLRKEYPELSRLINGKRVVDFGCGEGYESIALVKEEQCVVLGLDTNPRTLASAKANAARSALGDEAVQFLDRPKREMLGSFDVIISQNSMEHFPDPESIVAEMKALVRPNGLLLITFGPPWFAPYGSHMHFFCRIPWLNILFSGRTVMNVRALYRSDGARRYVDVESGLNMMSLRKFESLIARSGLEVRGRNYGCVKGQNWLANIPLIRELFVNRVSVILSPRSDLGARRGVIASIA